VPLATHQRARLRLLRVIKCLRLLERGCYSAEDMAGHFRVSKRTIYRDLRLLAEAGVPLARRTTDRRYHVPSRWPATQTALPGAGREPSCTSADSIAS